MLKPRHILIFIVILGLGLLIEGLKSLRDLSAPQPDKISASALKSLDVQPYHVSDDELAARDQRAEGRLHSSRLEKRRGMKLSGQKEQYDFSEGHEVAEKAAEKTTDKAADAKKKKKKNARGKKDKDKKTAEAEAMKKYAESDRMRGYTATPTQGWVQQGGAVAAPVQPEEEKLPITFEDWAKLVLGRPQPENIAKLIEFFQNGMVSGDVFYAILAALLEENDPEQHQLAVYAAGNVTNAQSFAFLAQVIERGGSAAAKAHDHIQAYQSLKNVTHLRTVLSTNLNEALQIQLAVNIVDQSSKALLETRSPSAEEPAATDSGRGRVDETVLAQRQAQAKQTFATFKPVLERVLGVYGGDASIATPAQKVLERIRTATVVVADVNTYGR